MFLFIMNIFVESDNMYSDNVYLISEKDFCPLINRTFEQGRVSSMLYISIPFRFTHKSNWMGIFEIRWSNLYVQTFNKYFTLIGISTLLALDRQWKQKSEQDRNTDLMKINRPGYNIRMYWTNFWQPAIHVQQNIFEKSRIEVYILHLYASFWHLLRPNRSIIRCIVSLWNMFENRQIAAIEGKCRRYRDPFEYLKTHCAALHSDLKA